MENCFILVQMFNEGCQSPLIVEFLCFIGAIIMENDFQSMIQECQFSKSLGENFKVEINFVEDAGVGPEMVRVPVFWLGFSCFKSPSGFPS